MFPTQYIPDFFVAQHYCLRNTSSWGSKDLATGIRNSVAPTESVFLKIHGARCGVEKGIQMGGLLGGEG
jgi:hypothetical protein